MITTFRLILLICLVICAIATAIVKKPMQAIIIYMAYSVIMSVIWMLLQSPDLAITEAAVGAGVTGILLFVTLHRINLIDKDTAYDEEMESRQKKDAEEGQDAERKEE